MKSVGNDPVAIADKLAGRTAKEIKFAIKDYRKKQKQSLCQSDPTFYRLLKSKSSKHLTVWSDYEHSLFLDGFRKHGKDWPKV